MKDATKERLEDSIFNGKFITAFNWNKINAFLFRETRTYVRKFQNARVVSLGSE